MENSTKAIMIGVALLITISVIAGVMIVTGIGTDMMSNSNNQLQGVSDSVATGLMADYDEKQMPGASVIASIKKFYNKPNFLLIADKKTSGVGFYSTLKCTFSHINSNYELDGSVTANNPTVTGLSSHISSTDNYTSHIIYAKGTDTILGVYFEK